MRVRVQRSPERWWGSFHDRPGRCLFLLGGRLSVEMASGPAGGPVVDRWDTLGQSNVRLVAQR